jgi:uncharacterized membrane protein
MIDMYMLGMVPFSLVVITAASRHNNERQQQTPADLANMTIAQLCEQKHLTKVKEVVKTQACECDVCYDAATECVEFTCGHGMCTGCAKNHISARMRPACHMCRTAL